VVYRLHSSCHINGDPILPPHRTDPPKRVIGTSRSATVLADHPLTLSKYIGFIFIARLLRDTCDRAAGLVRCGGARSSLPTLQSADCMRAPRKNNFMRFLPSDGERPNHDVSKVPQRKLLFTEPYGRYSLPTSYIDRLATLSCTSRQYSACHFGDRKFITRLFSSSASNSSRRGGAIPRLMGATLR